MAFAPPLAENFNRPECLNISIEFAVNSLEIDEQSAEKMAPLAKYWQLHHRARALLTGHTDNTGSRAYNQMLSRVRAESTKKYLRENFSLDEKRLLLQSAGADEPVADNGAPEGQAQNRRVLIQTCPE